jgi:ubiquinone/menaquinone biosynthesis C-methylase UbiE
MIVEPRQAGDLWAAEYDSTPNPLLALERRVIEERLGDVAGKTVIDCATGTGRWLEELRSRGAHPLGFDRSAAMAARASRMASGRVAMGDLLSIPFTDGAANLAICSFALSYVEDAAAVVRELARVAGRVIVSDLHPDAVAAGWRRGFRSGGERHEVRCYTHSISDVHRWFDAYGLRTAWEAHARFGEPERAIFRAAGREAAFEEVRAINAVWCSCWSRR